MTRDPFFKGFSKIYSRKGVGLVRATNINKRWFTDALKVKHWLLITA
jgi:hypothetical protein